MGILKSIYYSFISATPEQRRRWEEEDAYRLAYKRSRGLADFQRHTQYLVRRQASLLSKLPQEERMKHLQKLDEVSSRATQRLAKSKTPIDDARFWSEEIDKVGKKVAKAYRRHQTR